MVYVGRLIRANDRPKDRVAIAEKVIDNQQGETPVDINDNTGNPIETPVENSEKPVEKKRGRRKTV